MPWLSGYRVTPVLAQKSKTGEKNAKKIRRKVIEGKLSLPGKYSEVIEDAMMGYSEERLSLVGTRL